MSDQQYRREAREQFGFAFPSYRVLRIEYDDATAEADRRARQQGDARMGWRSRCLVLAWELPELTGIADFNSYRFDQANEMLCWAQAHAKEHGMGGAIEALERAARMIPRSEVCELVALADKILTFVDGGEDA